MIEPPPEPIDFTSTERMPVMWPVQRPPSHVSAVALTRPPEIEADVERRAAGVADDEVAAAPPRRTRRRAYMSAATGAIDGPEPTE